MHHLWALGLPFYNKILIAHTKNHLILGCLQAFKLEPVLPPVTGRPDHVDKVLKTRFHDAMTKLQPQRKELDLVIVILPDNNGNLYGRKLD